MNKEVINVIQVSTVVFSTILLLNYLDCNLETSVHLQIHDNISQFSYKNDVKHSIINNKSHKHGQKKAVHSKKKKFETVSKKFQKKIFYSSVHCMKMVCHFQNLYYNTHFDQFFFIHHKNSSFSGALHRPIKSLGLLQLSAVVDYDGNFFNVISVDFDKIKDCFIYNFNNNDESFNEIEETHFKVHNNISNHHKNNNYKDPGKYCKIFSKIFSITTNTIAFSRFHPSNIMHAIHDDILPYLHTIHKHSSIFKKGSDDRYEDFNIIKKESKNYTKNSHKFDVKNIKNNIYSGIPVVGTFKNDFKVRLFFLDDYDPGLYQRLYDHFSHQKPLYRYSIKKSHHNFNTTNREKLFNNENFNLGINLKFSNILVGLGRDSLWYQYGFKKHQNSLENTKNDVIRETINILKNEFKVNELNYVQKFEKVELRNEKMHRKTVDKNEELKRFLQSSLSINKKIHPNFKSVKRRCKRSVLLVRKENRLILNEAELVLGLVSNFGCKVITMSLEENSLDEIADEISKCDVLIGVHGSLLIMALFLPKDSLLLELYPYAVNPDLYTPFKKLCAIIGVRYIAWRNTNKNMSVWHINRPARLGGISHLPAKQQLDILKSEMVPKALCCDHAEWFFRIYQDTVVDVGEVIDLIKNASESKKRLTHDISQNYASTQPFFDNETLLLNRNNRQKFNIDDDNLIHDFKDHIVCLSKVENIMCTRNLLFNSTIKHPTKDNICREHSDINLHIEWGKPMNINLITYQFVYYEIWIETKEGRISVKTMSRFKVFTNHYTLYDLNGYLLYVVWVRACMDDGVCGPFNSNVIIC